MALHGDAPQQEWELAVHCGATVYVRKLHDSFEVAPTIRKCMVGFSVVICDDNAEYVEEPMMVQQKRALKERKASEKAAMQRKVAACMSRVRPEDNSEASASYEDRKKVEMANCMLGW